MSLFSSAMNILRRRKNAYQITFAGTHGESVLKDLARFCRANTSCFHPDERVHAVMEGRREVFLRIQHHLNLTDEQLLSLYTRKENDE